MAFKLYDTFGFPLDLTQVIAERARLHRRQGGLRAARWRAARRAASSRARARSRSAAVFQALAERVGADQVPRLRGRPPAKAKIVALVDGGAEVQAVGPYSKQVAIVTAETPFYGEPGGQIGDTGTLAGGRRAR